jgi:hypothetical protein
MTRENQGLQIALIVSVMLTVVFGGMTYYWYRQYDDTNTKANLEGAEKRKQTDLATNNANDVKALKALIGVGDTERVDAVQTKETAFFKEDMSKYGAGLPEEDHSYRKLVDTLSKTVEKRNGELADAKKRVQDLEQQIKVFEASKQPQIDKFKKASEDTSKDLSDQIAKFDAERERYKQDTEGLRKEAKDARDEAKTEKTESQKKSEEETKRIKDLAQKVENQANEISRVTSTKVDAFDGEVRWVDQHGGRVWINRGRADALPRQITLSVYPADTTDLTVTGSIKGSIEVTKILEDHLAEARVLNDNITDPIVPGDKVHTPLWGPGEKKHFALAGFMDIYGDGKNHLQTVMDLIRMNDGVVDSYVDEKGGLQGAITVKTRFLILGEAPTEKDTKEHIGAFGQLVGNAERLGIQKLTLPDMLNRMGWKNTAPVVHFGPDANPKDFAPKAPEGAPRKSGGTVSEIFKPRQPPAGSPSPTPPSAYHRF